MNIYIDGLTKIGNALGLKGRFLCEFGFDQIMNIIAPEPEMETVPIEVWAGVDISTERIHSIGSKESVDLAVADGADNLIKKIKLTGTITRPKKQPVEKSVSVEAWVDHTGDVYGGPIGGNGEYDRVAFKDHLAPRNRFVTLTATWTE